MKTEAIAGVLAIIVGMTILVIFQIGETIEYNLIPTAGFLVFLAGVYLVLKSA